MYAMSSRSGFVFMFQIESDVSNNRIAPNCQTELSELKTSIEQCRSSYALFESGCKAHDYAILRLLSTLPNG